MTTSRLIERMTATPSRAAEERSRRPPIGLRNWGLWAAMVLIGFLLMIAVMSDQLAPYPPHALSGKSLERPGAAHLLGTNDIGEDLFSQLLWGSRASLLVGFGAAAISTAVACVLGLVSGFGRRWSAAVGGIADLFLALPFLPVTLLVVAHLGPRLPVIVVTLGLVSWPTFARVMRARVATELAAGHVEAARTMGASPATILLRHVLPATLPVVTAKFVLTLQSAIVIEANLAFLGLGDPLILSWGGIVRRGMGYGLIFAGGAWQWWLVPPVVAMSVLIGAATVVGWTLDGRQASGGWRRRGGVRDNHG